MKTKASELTDFNDGDIVYCEFHFTNGIDPTQQVYIVGEDSYFMIRYASNIGLTEVIGNINDVMDKSEMAEILFKGRDRQYKRAFKMPDNVWSLLSDEKNHLVGEFNDICDIGTVIKRPKGLR